MPAYLSATTSLYRSFSFSAYYHRWEVVSLFTLQISHSALPGISFCTFLSIPAICCHSAFHFVCLLHVHIFTVSSSPVPDLPAWSFHLPAHLMSSAAPLRQASACSAVTPACDSAPHHHLPLTLCLFYLRNLVPLLHTCTISSVCIPPPCLTSMQLFCLLPSCASLPLHRCWAWAPFSCMVRLPFCSLSSLVGGLCLCCRWEVGDASPASLGSCCIPTFYTCLHSWRLHYGRSCSTAGLPHLWKATGRVHSLFCYLCLFVLPPHACLCITCI